MFKILIAEKVKSYREEKHLTQREFGARMGITPQAVYKWEKELSYPDISLLPTLAALLECQMEDFFQS